MVKIPHHEQEDFGEYLTLIMHRHAPESRGQVVSSEPLGERRKLVGPSSLTKSGLIWYAFVRTVEPYCLQNGIVDKT